MSTMNEVILRFSRLFNLRCRPFLLELPNYPSESLLLLDVGTSLKEYLDFSC